MILRKIKILFFTLFFVIYNFGPLSMFVTWEKEYKYEQEIKNINGKIDKVYLEETSLDNLNPIIDKYSLSGNIDFGNKKNLLVFKINKDDILDDNFEFEVINGNNKYSIGVDADGDERIYLDKYIYSKPIFISPTNKIAYVVKSKEYKNLIGDMQIVGVDTYSFDEKLAFNTQTKVNASSQIVSRSSWGADETLRYNDHEKWIEINKKYAEDQKNKTEADIQKEQRNLNIKNYLATNFPLQEKAIETISYENGRPLAWPISKTKRVEKIYVHHTGSSNDGEGGDEATIRGIYYYHTITRGWGDIGYNFLIGKDGKIYEGRAGGDYAVGAHNVWNNRSTVGVSALGNFETNKIDISQKNGIDKAIGVLAKKYGIDLNKKSISHKECFKNEDCLIKDFETYNLVGHKDAGYTSCPGSNLYLALNEFRDYGRAYSNGLTYINNTSSSISNNNTTQKGPSIKIRLSYEKNFIEIKSYTDENMKIQVGSRKGYTKIPKLKFAIRPNNKIALIIGTRQLLLDNIKLSSTILEIPTWERKYSWDSTQTINDNKFRGSITIYNDNGKLTLVNELPLEDYLKGIAEISNTENPEKAKTILVAARTYALYYTNPNNRKFPGKPYDGSDDPNEFQRYVGYSFELRSSNITKLVEETSGEVIKYNGEIIKPWYFNRSNGKTKSYKEYCEERVEKGILSKGTVCEDIPYLQSVSDPGGITNLPYNGHGVGISGLGAKYLAEHEMKNYKEIIGYFLSGVKIEKTIY